MSLRIALFRLGLGILEQLFCRSGLLSFQRQHAGSHRKQIKSNPSKGVHGQALVRSGVFFGSGSGSVALAAHTFHKKVGSNPVIVKQLMVSACGKKRPHRPSSIFECGPSGCLCASGSEGFGVDHFMLSGQILPRCRNKTPRIRIPSAPKSIVPRRRAGFGLFGFSSALRRWWMLTFYGCPVPGEPWQAAARSRTVILS